MGRRTYRVTFKYGNDPRGTVRARLVDGLTDVEALERFHVAVGAVYLDPDAYVRLIGLECLPEGPP